MTAITCGECRTLGPEFALEVLGGAERAEVVDHTAHCAACRAFVDELSETVDEVTTLAPEAAPPAGFEDRVLRAIATERARVNGRRTVRQRVIAGAALAAVAAAAAVLAIAGVRIADHAPAAAPPSHLQATAMVGAGGTGVGQVYWYHGSPGWMFVHVDYGSVQSGAYRVEALMEDRSTTALGTLTVGPQGDGTWGGLVPPLGGAPREVRLVDQSGRVVCTADLTVGAARISSD